MGGTAVASEGSDTDKNPYGLDLKHDRPHDIVAINNSSNKDLFTIEVFDEKTGVTELNKSVRLVGMNNLSSPPSDACHQEYSLNSLKCEPGSKPVVFKTDSGHRVETNVPTDEYGRPSFITTKCYLWTNDDIESRTNIA